MEQKWGNYWQQPDGVFYDTATFAPSNAPLVPGQMFFVLTPDASTTTNTLPLMGEVVTVVIQKIDIVPGLNGISYPFSSSVELQDTTFLADGGTSAFFPGDADQIWVLPASGSWKNYFLNADGSWYDSDTFSPVTDTALDLGQGFWYEAKGAFTWSETNKYLNNL